MPFIRSTRDKRGYETTLVMHGYRTPQGASQTRVLYLFRSPSHLRLGRQPLDEEAREALEHTHPDLSFDWQALGRETIRTDERDRDAWRSRRGTTAGKAKSAPKPAAVPDDPSLLGQTLGGREAARLRMLYGNLLQRIERRARTPEQRDRLTEAAQRLNPDGWPDASTIRSQAPTVEAEWETLTAELPGRRRGRRGGRGREGAAGPAEEIATATDVSELPAPEAIMTHEGEEVDATPIAADTPRTADPGGPGDDADGRPATAGDDIPG